MFGRRITLFTVLGFTVRLDPSWLLLAGIVATATASGFREPPASFPVATSWAMGLAITVGLFFSIVLHELTHSIVARTHGMHMRGITLFLLGGVAEMEDEPPTPWAEFGMAIVGPIASLVIAAALGASWKIAGAAQAPDVVLAVVASLALMNVGLAIFNLVPAFPLDGGRVLRSLLWAFRRDQLWATRVASFFGMGFGILFAALGVVFTFVWPRTWQGVTWILIGVFVVVAARSSVRQLLVRRALDSILVRGLMRAGTVVVPRWIPLDELVEHMALGGHPDGAIPVVDGGTVVGVVMPERLWAVPREEWQRRAVGEITSPVPMDAFIDAGASAHEALSRMGRTGRPILWVIDAGRLAGTIRHADVVDYLRRPGFAA